MEKEKATVARENEDLHAAVDTETKAKLNQEKLAKQLELQVAELQQKCDEQARQLAESLGQKSRLANEAGELGRHLEDAEGQINALNRFKQQFASQAEEAKRNYEQEAKVTSIE